MAFILATPQGSRQIKNITAGAAVTLATGMILTPVAGVLTIATTTTAMNQPLYLYTGAAQTTTASTVVQLIELFKNDELTVTGLSGNVSTTVGNRVTFAAGGLTVVQGTDVTAYTTPAPVTVNGFISATSATVKIV